MIELFYKLGEVKCIFNGVMYSLFMVFYFKVGNFEKVFILFRVMRESGIGVLVE